MKELIACLVIGAGTAQGGLFGPPDAGAISGTLLGEPSRTVRIPGSERDVLLWDTTDASGATKTMYAFRDADGSVGPAVEQRTMLRTKLHTFDPLDAQARPLFSIDPDASSELFIVQFVVSPRPDLISYIESMGASVYSGYLPDQAYVVQASPGVIAGLRGLDVVRCVLPLYPDLKIDPGIPEEVPRGGVRVHVYCNSELPGSREMVDSLLKASAVDARSIRATSKGFIATVDSPTLIGIAKTDACMHIALHEPPRLDSVTSREIIGSTSVAAAGGFEGTGVRGEIFDLNLFVGTPSPTPVDQAASQGRLTIRSNARSCPGTSNSRHGLYVFGVLFSSDDPTAVPGVEGVLPKGHAIFNTTNERDDVGLDCMVRPLVQLAPDPALVPGCVLDVSSSPDAEYRAVFQSASFNTDTPSNSYAARGQEADSVCFYYDFLIAHSTGNVFTDAIGQQATGKNVLSVGGIIHFGSTDPDVHAYRTYPSSTAGFGPSRGPVDLEDRDPGDPNNPLYGRIKPDLVSASDDILTASTNGSITQNGTSFSTPVVAGAAGIVFEMWGRQFPLGSSSGENIFRKTLASTTGVADTDVFANRPGPAVVKGMLINSAAPYDWVNGSAANSSITRDVQGWGRPDLKNLYRRAVWNQDAGLPVTQCISSLTDWPPVIRVIPEDRVLEQGEFLDRCFEVIETDEDLRITLVWTDPPPSIIGGQPLVNDLDLRVTAPDGTTVYHGNFGLVEDGFSDSPTTPPHGIWSQPGGFSDKINNVENVFIPGADLQPGLYRVRVTAAAVPVDGNMPVWTGCSTDPVDSTPPVSSGPIDAKFALVMSRGACTADFDQDGTVDQADSTAFTSAFTSGGLRADINCDGLINFFDISAFNAAFSEGCP